MYICPVHCGFVLDRTGSREQLSRDVTYLPSPTTRVRTMVLGPYEGYFALLSCVAGCCRIAAPLS